MGVRERIRDIFSESSSTDSTSGVRMYHGATALTRIRSKAHSTARLRVVCKSAAFVIAEGPPLLVCTRPETEETLTTLAPDAQDFRSLCAARVNSKADVRFVETMRSYSSAVYSTAGLRMFVPTLLTRTSRPASNSSTRRSTALL